MTEPNVPTERAAEAGAGRLDAFVYDWRNVLAAVPLLPAWLAMDEPATGAEIALAVALVALGMALRAWGTLHNRYAQGRGRKTLATGGPYSWLRNPLYVANSLVLLGGFASSGQLAALPAGALWLAAVYTLTVRHEEQRLHEKYGAEYLAYCARVGRWWPTRRGERPHVPLRPFLGALAAELPCLLVIVPYLLRHAF